jgi:hypothetical protein
MRAALAHRLDAQPRADDRRLLPDQASDDRLARGEAWFWDTLVDADPANNAASWQWVAGSGADAAPYFRIFNPVPRARSSMVTAPTHALGAGSRQTAEQIPS